MDIKEILEMAFDENVEIKEKLQAGLRCQTYLVEFKGIKYIFQIYLDSTIYQAKKKYDILKLFEEDTIPKVYDYKVTDEFAYLITEYKAGDRVTNLYNDADFKINRIAEKLGYTLSKIHQAKQDKIFGWITDETIFENECLIDYIKSEYNRMTPNLDGLNEELKKKILDKVNKAIDIIEKKSENLKYSCLCWYDINPDNILVAKEDSGFELKGFIDPGGARLGIEEWDLAFIKMELCRNEDEFKSILNAYLKYTEKTIDMELLEALTVIVELDDISIRILDGITIPIPYDTNFEDEIRIIENEINR